MGLHRRLHDHGRVLEDRTRLQPGTNSTGQERAAGKNDYFNRLSLQPGTIDPRGPKAK